MSANAQTQRPAAPVGGGMRGGMHGMGRGSRPKNIKKTAKRILSYVFENKALLLLVAFLVVISSLAGVAGSYFFKPLINNYVAPMIGSQNPDLSGFVSLLLIMGAIYVAGILATYGYSRIMIKISTGVLKKIRVDMFTHMQRLPIKYFDTRTHGEIMSRYTNDTDAMRELLGNGISQLISSSVSVVGVFVMMLVLSWQLTLLVLVMLAIMLFVIKTLGKKSGAYFIKQQGELGRVNGYIEEMIEGQRVIKVFCREEIVKKDFDAINEELYKAASSAHTFASILMPIMGNLSYIHYALTAALGAVLAIKGHIDVGTIGSFLLYTRSFTSPLTQLSQQFNSALAALAGAERIFALLDEAPETEEGSVSLVTARKDANGNIEECGCRTGMWAWKKEGENGPVYTELRGDVRFENVTFGYEPEKPVLHDVSLYAKPGQKIAFVGSTGAGKTTITNLINRFYDIQQGRITYDGIDIKAIKKDDLRRSLSMVLQDTHLFTGSVMENIRYGRLEATDDEVISAAKLANAHFFISHLPQGYHTLLTADGSNLSQGQRQLIAIARAAVADPPVLILDEATSSIDTRTEAHIEKGMDSLMSGRTVFVIAHRLSTVRNSNAIMVLENGRIIERGDHEALLSQKGKYYQLYTGMFELS